MIDDVAFERDLRTMLTSRDPGPAPAGLGPRIRATIAADRPTPWLGVAVQRLATAAVLTAAAVLMVAVLVKPNLVGPGASPGPNPSTPAAYVLRPGDGVTTALVPIPQFLVGLIAGAALFVVALRTTTRRTRIVASIGALAIVFTATQIGTSNALTFGSGGYGVVPTRAAGEGEEGMIVAATGDAPYTVFLTITNTSSLPLTLKGVPDPGISVISTGTDSTAYLPRFVAIARLSGAGFTADQIEPFQPITIAAGDTADIAILGMPGTCAVPIRTGGSYGIAQIALVYEQLTIDHEELFVLPEPIIIPIATPCP